MSEPEYDLAAKAASLFRKWKGFSGRVGAGQHADWIGMRFATKWYENADPPPERDVGTQSEPHLDEEYFEWLDLLDSVDRAGDHYVVMELGAGWGRWGIRAALAAAQLGKSYEVIMAEAEPQHVEWLKEAVTINRLPESSVEIVPCAVTATTSPVAFLVSSTDGLDAQNWYGQALYRPDSVTPTDRKYFGQPVYEWDKYGLVFVETRTLTDLLSRRTFVDLIDMDIQGAEAEVVKSSMAALNEKVRRVHIGTHGREIEEELRSCFRGAGWISVWDFMCNAESLTPFGITSFQDGVQGWLNPRL